MGSIMKKWNISKVKKGIHDICLAAGILIAALYLSRKVFLIMAVFGVFSYLMVKKRKGNKSFPLLLISAVMIFGNIVYNLFRLDGILPFYQYHTQAMYHETFLEEGIYPDLFFRLLLKNKSVSVRDNLLSMKEIEKTKDDYYKSGKSYFYPYYHGWNTYNFVEAFSKEVVQDDALNGQRVSEEVRNRDFLDFGAVNDMLRYSFLLSKYEGEMGRYFNHYWYYNHFIDSEIHMYVCLKGLEESRDLVVLWEEDSLEHIYVMSKEYYEEEVEK